MTGYGVVAVFYWYAPIVPPRCWHDLTLRLTSHLQLLYGSANYTTFTKDAFHRYIIHGEKDAVNSKKRGTKVAPYYVLVVGPDEERVLKCRLMANDEIVKEPFAERNFGAIIQKRLKEADEFYNVAIPCKLFLLLFLSQLSGKTRQDNFITFLHILQWWQTWHRR